MRAANSSAAAATTSAAAKQQLLYDGIALDMDGTLTSCVIDFVDMRKRTGGGSSSTAPIPHTPQHARVTSATLTSALTASTNFQFPTPLPPTSLTPSPPPSLRVPPQAPLLRTCSLQQCCPVFSTRTPPAVSTSPHPSPLTLTLSPCPPPTTTTGIPVGDLFVAMESWEEPEAIKASMDVILEIGEGGWGVG